MKPIFAPLARRAPMPVPVRAVLQAASHGALLSALLLLGACSDGPSAPEAPAVVVALSGSGQTRTAGTLLPAPLVARVLDDDGDPVAGIPVNFVVTGGGGAVSVATATTGRDGRAESRWTLGTSAAAAQTAEARVAVGTTTLSAGFTATATAGPPSAFAAVGATALTGPAVSTLAPPLEVRVADSFGNPVAGVPMAWKAEGGGGMSNIDGVTGADGVARVTWTLGRSLTVPQRLIAEALPLGREVVFTATLTVPADAVVEPFLGDGATVLAGNGSMQIAAYVRTPGGVPLSGVPVTFTVPAGAQINVPEVPTRGDGRAYTYWMPPTKVGTYTVTARVAGATDEATLTVTVTPNPYQPGSVQAVGLTTFSTTPGAVLGEPLRVRVTDRFGNRLPGVQVQWNRLQGSSTAAAAESTTDANGIASVQVQAGTTAEATVFEARVDGASLPFPAFQVSVVPGPIATFVFDQPARTVNVGVPDGFVVQAQAYDAFGNRHSATTPVTWSSDNPGVATVARSSTSLPFTYVAEIDVHATGTARIRVTAPSGGFGEMTLTVVP